MLMLSKGNGNGCRTWQMPRCYLTPPVFHFVKKHPPQGGTTKSHLERGVLGRRGVFMLYASLLILIASPRFVYIAAASELENQLRALLEELVVVRLNLPRNDFLMEISDFNRTAEQDLPFDKIEILPSRRPIRKGVQMVRFGLFEGTRLLKDFQAKVRIRTFQNIVVAKTKLTRHKIIRAEDLMLNRRETTKLKADRFHTLMSAVIGLRTKRLTKEDGVIAPNGVETVPLINRGSEVEIHFSKGPLNIVLPGIAREDGHSGKSIRVQCLENRRSYQANVIDSHTVKVNLL